MGRKRKQRSGRYERSGRGAPRVPARAQTRNWNEGGKASRFRRVKRMMFVLLFLSLAYIGYVAYEVYQASKASYYALERGEKSELRENPVTIADDPISFLILGIEDYATGGDHGRTDTLMVVTLNPHSKSMNMLSIPRDSRVMIVGKDVEDKINHAHAFGGTDMTIATVEHFLDIPIDYFIKVNFDGFIDVIDEIGGVTVDVPFNFSEDTTKKGVKAYFKKGPMHLTGEEALAYVRMRKMDPRGDFGRNDRQKQVLKAAIEQALTVTTLFKVDKIAEHLGANVETNLRPQEIIALQRKYASFDTDLVENMTLEGDDLYENRIYYFIPREESVEAAKIRLQTHLDL